MESYEEFLDRINSFERSALDLGGAYFTCNPSMAHKVDKSNRFKSFYGDTVVFDLDKTGKSIVSGYVDRLYDAAPQCFCERLASDTFHMTLHDLSNSAKLRDISDEMFFNELEIVQRIPAIRKAFGDKIELKGNAVFNMVNTSLVFGLYPVDRDNYNKLMALYSVFDDVKKLNYPLTPHITLAYFNINGFDRESACRLIKTVEKLNSECDIEVEVGELYYQKFTDMNTYINIIKLRE